MAGKHAAPSTGSKKPLIITISVVAAIAVIAAVTVIIIMMNNKSSEPDKKPTQATTAALSTAAETTRSLPDNPPSTEKPAENHSTEPATTLNINIPTEAGSVITHFNATYIPNGEVLDATTGASMTLRDVFGSGYANGVLTFNEDGTFTDSLSSSGTESGQYNVENGEIKATYATDRNMDITVTEWNEADKTPAAFYIIYNGGFIVYFSEN